MTEAGPRLHGWAGSIRFRLTVLYSVLLFGLATVVVGGLITSTVLKDLVYLRDSMGFQMAFLEDPVVHEAILLVRGQKNAKNKLRLAAKKEAAAARAKAKAGGDDSSSNSQAMAKPPGPPPQEPLGRGVLDGLIRRAVSAQLATGGDAAWLAQTTPVQASLPPSGMSTPGDPRGDPLARMAKARTPALAKSATPGWSLVVRDPAGV